MSIPNRQGILSKALNFIGLEKKGSLAAPDPWLLELLSGGSPSIAGPFVSPLTAMGCAPVRCAIQAIAETIGQMPVGIFQRGDNGTKQEFQDHPAYALLNEAANDWTPGSTLREQLTRDALLEPRGGFALINRVNGKPIELLRLDPLRNPVTVKDGLGGEPLYEMTEGGVQKPIDRNDIIHIPSPSHSPFGMLHDAKQSIGLAIVLEQHAARLFGRGARPAGLLKFPNKLDTATSGRMKASWQAAHGGTNSGGTAVLEEGAEFQPITFNSVDAQFLEIWKFTVEQIARHFRVNPVFLMDLGRATWSNAEEFGNQFLTFTLLPWILRWEGEIALKLFTAEERKTLFPKFSVDALLRADFQKRMQGYQFAIAARIFNPNEVRAWEGLPPYVGGEKFENPNTSSPLPVVPA